MAHYTHGARAICPFYLKEASKSITCEGLVEGTESMNRFESTEEMERFQSRACDTHEYAAHCPLARALMRKYETREDAI